MLEIKKTKCKECGQLEHALFGCLNCHLRKLKEDRKLARREYNRDMQRNSSWNILHRNDYMREYRKRDYVKERAREYNKKRYRKPGVKERMAEYTKEYRKRPEVRERLRLYWKSRRLKKKNENKL
jgi:hypothetical protein